MEQQELPRMNMSTPNLIVVCVDQMQEGDIGGRFYYCYEKEPVKFESIVELMTKADRFFDEIAFPQASTEARSFTEKKKGLESKAYNKRRPERRVAVEEMLSHRGEKETFAVSVKFRQRSTWQGELLWLEESKKASFTNMLELLAQIDKVLLLRKDT